MVLTVELKYTAELSLATTSSTFRAFFTLPSWQGGGSETQGEAIADLCERLANARTGP